MGQGQVANVVWLSFAKAARSEGIELASMLEGLPVTASQLADPRGSFSWDVLAEVCERVEARVGEDGLARIAPRLLQTQVAAPLIGMTALVLDPDALYPAVARWVAPRYFTVGKASVERLGDRRVAIDITIDEAYRGSPAWFRLTGHMLAAFPTLAGLPPARVDVEIMPRRGRYVITSPRQRLRDRARALGALFSPRATVAELVRQREELDAATSDARRHEEFARAILDRVDEIVVVVEPDARIRYISPAVERILGFTPPELLGKSVFALLDPDDGPVVAPKLGPLMSVPGFAVRDTLRMRAKDGTVRHIDAAGVNLTDDAAIRGVLLNGRDVTARLTAEKALRDQERAFSSLLANVQGMAYRCRNDAHWTMELVSAGAHAVTGYEVDELVGNRVVAFNDLIHPDDAGPLWEKCQINLDARRPCNNEYRIRHKDGSWRWVVDVASGVYDDGGLVAIEGFLSDVTDRHKLEEQLAHSQRLEGIGRLAGGIAHDFNNLLAAMLAYAELAVRGLPADSPAVADIHEIKSAALRAADLTRQLLAFARRQVLRPTLLDVNELVVGIDRLLRRILGADVDLQTIPGPDLWLIEADHGQIEQVLMNLAVNAREAMPNGGQLTIETSNVQLDDHHAAAIDGLAAGEYVLLVVTDTGEGMSPEVQRHAFEPFYTTKSSGTGLGLATCHGIVAQAGGGIFVYSEPGQGTSFKVYLPRSRRTAGERSTPTIEVVSGAGQSILLVEDHAQLRASMARSLESAGYRVSTASEGREALAVLAKEDGAIDLLLTDVVMPGMGGHELAVAARKLHAGLRVLFVSGYTENSVIRQGVPGAGVHFLAKPYTLAQLSAKVAEVLASEVSPL